MSEKQTGIYELLDAVEAVIQSADPKKREHLAQTMDAYMEDEHSADDLIWAIGPQAPAMLNHLINTIDAACRPESQSRARPVFRLVDRKPEGSA